MVTRKFSENFKWILGTFVSVLGVIWLVEEQVGIQSGTELFLGNSLASIIIVSSIGFILAFDSWTFNRFLKLSNKKSISIIFSACKDTREWSRAMPREKKERYYKIKNGEKDFLEGPHQYVIGLETALLVSQFVYRLRDVTNYELRLKADDENLDGNGPLFCFGSSRSNLKTEQFLPKDIVEFKGADNLILKIFKKPTSFVSTDFVDYGVLARVKHQNHWVFIFAGIDEEGTVGASFYFLQNWKRFTSYKEKPFIHIVECKKGEHMNPKKMAGYFLSRSGIWEADQN